MITADGQFRGGREIPLKPVVDEALAMGDCDGIKTVFVWKRTGSAVPMKAGRDVWWHDAVAGQADTCEPTWVGAEHPLFILYTSGSTGKPKGVQHSTGGYLLQAILTMKWTFDYKPTDVFWCTADVGWVTGHTYIAYGPLACGATEVMFEGVPTYPDAGRFWKMIQDHKVTVFYTAPTAIRSLIKAGGDLPKKYDLTQLRILGTVGEPINPEAWMWYYETVGGGSGAGPLRHGAAGVQVHMTNTRNTPIEAIETEYPLRVEEYRLRSGSGGDGLHRGGEGIVRRLRFLCPARLTVVSERRAVAPWGLRGGRAGSPGSCVLSGSDQERILEAKCTLDVVEGNVLTIATPGGGGWGPPSTQDVGQEVENAEE